MEHRFDADAEFLRESGSLRVHRVMFPSPVETAIEANNTVHAEYFQPAGKGPFPAVVSVHGHWAQGKLAGLMFVAFGKSFDAFEVQMRRMAGQDDGITDALFRISKPVNGAFFWCPPLREGRLDLRLLGL
jgi:hypothetical protein